MSGDLTTAAIEAAIAERTKLRSECDRLRAWLRKACNELDVTGAPRARKWAEAIREEVGLELPAASFTDEESVS